MGIKTKTVCVKKQRKLSKVLPCNAVSDGNGSDEAHDILIENTDTGQEDDNRCRGRNVISMESMVTIQEPHFNQLYLDAIAKLKYGNFKHAEDNLLKIIRHVSQTPSYGVYSLHSRSENKRTTLSALNMFMALSSGAGGNLRRAIMFCNKAIAEDPGWMIPFSKREEYFKYFEKQLSEQSSGATEEVLRARLSADIIVDPGAGPEVTENTEDGPRIVSSLQEALSLAEDGEKIFLEAGRYTRAEGWSVTSRVAISGAGAGQCVLVSAGSPTLQICAARPEEGVARAATPILIQRLQFLNNCDEQSGDSGEVTSSNAAHLYIISPDTVTVKECLFTGGEKRSGGILIAEEAFYRSLLELEFENPELLSDSGSGMSDKCLRLFVDFCIFTECQRNSCLFSNNQATVIVSNTVMSGCGRLGVSAGEGSSVSLLNCHISDCSISCVSADNVSTINILGSYLSESGGSRVMGRKQFNSGIVVTEKSKATVSRSLLRSHRSAVSVDDADLVFEENCVMDCGTEDSVTEAGLELEQSAIYISRAGNVVVRANNFHNCNLVWQIQHGSSPRIEDNNVETCLIGFIVSRGSAPRIEGNSLQCALVSVGMVMEKSSGNIYNNTFNYVSNGLDIHNGCSPVLVRNIYKFSGGNISPGAGSDTSPGLKYDVVKVREEDRENLTDTEVITITENCHETAVVEEIMRRKHKSENVRNCSYCGIKTSCLMKCSLCDQIYYCSSDCRVKDSVRHKAFCNLSIKDLF